MKDDEHDFDLPPDPESIETSSDSDRVKLPDKIRAVLEEIGLSLDIPTNGTSLRKIAANRLNALKSTGPKTPQGKISSSRNSTRHGLLAKGLMLAGRDKTEYARLLRRFQEDRKPVGALEEALVEKIAYEFWRLGLAGSYETEQLADVHRFKTTAMDRITRYQGTINRSSIRP